jgi:tryptophan 7-halogenase
MGPLSMRQPKSIIILGSGASAWTLAAWLGELMRPAQIKLTLVELSESSGLAETSGSSLGRFNDIIGLSEKSIIQTTESTFNYARRYENWASDGQRFMLPEAALGDSFKGVPFVQLYTRARSLGLNIPLDSYSLSAWAALHNKFAHPARDAEGIYTTLTYGLNLDLKGYAALLKAKALAAGVIAIQSDLDSLEIHGQSGYVNRLKLQNGALLEVDLVLDCSLDGQLVLQQLRAPQTVNHTMPSYGAGLIAERKLDVMAGPYGRISARAGGFVRAVPLKTRMLYDYSYAKDLSTESEVLEDLAQLGAEPLYTYARAEGNFVMDKFWDKNTIAMGAAAYQLPHLHFGVLEQLRNEVARLGDLLMGFDELDILAEEYNRLTRLEYTELSELNELQLYMAGKNSGALQQFYAERGLSAGASHRYKLFAGHGRTGAIEPALMSAAERSTLFMGNDILPCAADLKLAALSDQEVINYCRQLAQMITAAGEKLPFQAEYIQRLMTL